MKIERILINELKPATYNPRQISTKQYKDLEESIDKFGLVDPIIVNKDMTIIGGHQRYKIWSEKAKQSSIDDITIPCVVLELTKEEERELNIRLNKSGGEWDMDILANEFDVEELKDWGFKEIDLGLNIDKLEEPSLDELIEQDSIKAPAIKITFKTNSDLEQAEKEIKELIKLYKGSFYSISN